MAIFPVSPTIGQEETVLGRTFIYDGYGWVVKVSGGHTILDPAENTMPTQSALKFGAGFTVTDETGKTVVGLIFEETLIFRDIEVFEFTKSQSFKITQIISESGVTASIKIHGTETDYVINDTVPAFNRLDISVDVLGAITVKGILV